MDDTVFADTTKEEHDIHLARLLDLAYIAFIHTILPIVCLKKTLLPSMVTRFLKALSNNALLGASNSTTL